VNDYNREKVISNSMAWPKFSYDLAEAFFKIAHAVVEYPVPTAVSSWSHFWYDQISNSGLKTNKSTRELFNLN
jgi:hypothetical protein